MIKRYSTPEAYAAAGVPTDESRVAQIEQTGEIKVDGVNVIVPIPGDGDAVFEDAEGNVKFVRYDTINKSRLDATWTHIGFAFGYDGKTVRVMAKDENTAGLKWLNCWQYDITAISAATIKFYLHMKGDYAVWVPIEVTLSDSSNGYINATSAAEITAALEAAGNTGNVGYANHGYWAYLAMDKIVVQCDFCADYRQYQVSDGSHALVGCTMSLSVWEDMPASSAYWRKSGVSTYFAPMNLDKAVAYYSTNGKTPTANWALNATDFVNKNSFDTSAYCADLRAAYGTYRNYLAHSMVLFPAPKYGVFKLPDADEMTRLYANKTFTKKDGVTTDYKFPALHYGATIGYGTGKFAVGKWHLSDVPEGVLYMEDTTMAKLAEAQTRMNTTVLTNAATRWFARRYFAASAWYFNQGNGTLTNTNVANAYRCRACTLLTL